MTTTNFEEFINGLSDNHLEEIFNLYTCVETNTNIGSYTCEENNEMYFVKEIDNDLTLMLASEDARKAFLKVLDYKFGGELGISLQYDFIRNMKKDD